MASYPAHQDRFVAPGHDELDALEADLRARSAAALISIGARPPLARPDSSYCSHCPVRQLCGDYWDQLKDSASAGSSPSSDRPIDVELTIRARNGPRSWLGVVRAGIGLQPESRAVLRTQQDDAAISVGDTMRILNVSMERDETEGLAFLTASDYSEVFPLRAPRPI